MAEQILECVSLQEFRLKSLQFQEKCLVKGANRNRLCIKMNYLQALLTCHTSPTLKEVGKGVSLQRFRLKGLQLQDKCLGKGANRLCIKMNYLQALLTCNT
jgi:hypothetical protein